MSNISRLRDVEQKKTGSDQQHRHQRRRSKGSGSILPADAASPQTHLSDLLPPHIAVRILGAETTRIVLRNYLRSACNDTTNNSDNNNGVRGRKRERAAASSSSGRRWGGRNCFRYRHPLDGKESVDEKAEIDLLLFGLAYDFDNNNHGAAAGNVVVEEEDDKSGGGGSSSSSSHTELRLERQQQVAKAWSKLGYVPIPGYNVDITAELSLFDSSNCSSNNNNNNNNNNDDIRRSRMTWLNSSTTTTATTTAEQILLYSLHTWQNVYGLDKLSFLKYGILLPPTTVPPDHRSSGSATTNNSNNNSNTAGGSANNGHMALLECIFNALATTPPEPGTLIERTMSIMATTMTIGRKSITTLEEEQEEEQRLTQILASSMAASSSRGGGGGGGMRNNGGGGGRVPRILLPDLIIMFAIVRLGEMDMSYCGYLETMKRQQQQQQQQRQSHELEDCKMDVTNVASSSQSTTTTPPAPSTIMLPPPPKPPHDNGVQLTCLLAFRIYDGYQRQNTLTRDTLQRFLSDIHGEESYKTVAVQSILDRLFTPPLSALDGGGAGGGGGGERMTNSNSVSRLPPVKRVGSPLNVINPDLFQLGVRSTIDYLPTTTTTTTTTTNHASVSAPSSSSFVGSHILLDWILIFFNCMLPKQLPPSPILCDYHLRIVNSDPSLMIDVLCTKYGLIDGNDIYGVDESDNVLYEIRRRFHSIEQRNSSKLGSRGILDNDGEVDINSDDTSSLADDLGAEESDMLLTPENEEDVDDDEEEHITDASAIVKPHRPKNVIDEDSFIRAVSEPNNDLGHGGYLPIELARLTFRAISGRAAQDRRNEDTTNNRSVVTRPESGEYYLSIYDVLSYGCEAVRFDAKRGEDDDCVSQMHTDHDEDYASEIPLLKLAFKTFLQISVGDNNKQVDETLLNRSQIGRMLLLLLEHKSYRLDADSPTFSLNEAGKDKGGELSKSITSMKQSSGVGEDYVIDINDASLFGLLPPSFPPLTTCSSIPLSKLIDYVISEASDGSKSGLLSIDFEGFVRWHLNRPITKGNTGANTSVCETRLGLYLLDLRLIASVLFGVKPGSGTMENVIVSEIERRHKNKYPRSKEQPHGPSGTTWYVVNSEWWRTWQHFAARGNDSKEINGDYHLTGMIDNNNLMSVERILSLKQGLEWHRDFELLEPLTWSALQAWHDGGPPITREVVPFHQLNTDLRHHMSIRARTSDSSEVYEEYAIELYPLFANVFLCDKASQGEPRPFQQFVPLSMYLPLDQFVAKLREGLLRGSKLIRSDSRLWLIDGINITNSTSGKELDTMGWILDLDHPINDKRNLRTTQLKKNENISLLLELRNEDGSWPRSKVANDRTVENVQKADRANEQKEEMVLGDGIVGLYNMG